MPLNTSSHKILIVDDELPIRELIAQIISKEGYPVATAADVDEALQKLEKDKFSLVISDINMPGKSGIDLLDHIIKKHSNLAVLMATAVDDRNVAIRTLEKGAYGYIIKPFERNELVINVANALGRLELEVENQRYSEELEELVDERTKDLKLAEQEIRASREETIYRLAKAAEFRDNETAQHTMRMGYYCDTLARNLGLDNDLCERIRLASPLHDVGKIGVSDTILLKPGELTKDEFEIIKQHPLIGYRILADSKAELLNLGAIIAYTHHERFDGSGYPRQLQGHDIPLVGRIAAICDVFDALTSNRVYKAAMSADDAVQTMMQGNRSHFDPDLLRCFMDCLPEILSLKMKFADG